MPGETWLADADSCVARISAGMVLIFAIICHRKKNSFSRRTRLSDIVNAPAADDLVTKEKYCQPRSLWLFMMTSSNGNILRVTGPLCGEFTGPRWIPPHKGQWRGALMFSLICTRINGWVNNGDAGDLRRHRAHYDVTVTYVLSTIRGDCSWVSNIFISMNQDNAVLDNGWNDKDKAVIEPKRICRN